MIGGFSGLGKTLIIFGIVLVLAGIFFIFINRVPFLGKLPGDIYINKKNFTFYFPITTSLLISLIASFILWLWLKR